MAAASEDALASVWYWPPAAGSATRSACGNVISNAARTPLKPTVAAASVCPRGTDRMPARKISARKVLL